MRKLISLLLVTIFMTGCGGSAGSQPSTEPPESAVKEEPAETSDSNATTDSSATTEEAEFEIPEVSKDVVTDEGFDQLAPPAKGDTVAVIKTGMGEITVKFFAEDAPRAVENFITHAKDGYYDGVTFHRVINDFMIQGGDPEGTGRGGESIWGQPFEDELAPRLHNYRGALSMANSGINTNGSQFFIVQAGPVDSEMLDYIKLISEHEEAMYQDHVTGKIVGGAQRFSEKSVDIYKEVGGTPFLDGGFPSGNGRPGGHTVFGQVIEGMDVVDAIAAVATDADGKPVEPVVIEKIEIKEYND